MFNPRLFGSDLRHWRVSAKIEVKTIAKKLSVSTKTINNWENDVGAPNFSQTLKWFVVCNLNSIKVVKKLMARKNHTIQIDYDEVKDTKDTEASDDKTS